MSQELTQEQSIEQLATETPAEGASAPETGSTEATSTPESDEDESETEA